MTFLQRLFVISVNISLLCKSLPKFEKKQENLEQVF